MLKKKWLFLIVVLAIILVGTFFYILVNCTSYDLYFSEPDGTQYTDIKITYSESDIVTNSEPVHEDGYLKITFYPLKQGTTDAQITYSFANEDSDIETLLHPIGLKVGMFNIVYRDSGDDGHIIPNISGFPVYYVSAALFFGIMAVYLIFRFRKGLKEDLFSYNTILKCGLMIICAGLTIFFTTLSVYLLFTYRDHLANTIQILTPIILMLIVWVSAPFILLYAVLMTISNISLIRHEGFRVANALGIVISALMVLGTFTCVILSQILNFYHLVSSVIFSIISLLVIFCEIFLLSTQICAFAAAKHKPDFNKDYIIILGC